jgi:hypothetical protein
MSEITVSTSRYMRVGITVAPERDNHVCPNDRIAVSLRDPEWVPDRAQVAWLIAAAFRSGRRGRDAALSEAAFQRGREAGLAEAAELNLEALRAAYTAPPFSADSIVRHERVVRHRRESDAEARLPREGDHPGGAVEPWESDLEPPPVPGMSTRVRRTRNGIEWAAW